MSVPEPGALLRRDALDGRVVVFAGGPARGGSAACVAAGADVRTVDAELADEEAVAAAVAAISEVDVLVVDAATLFDTAADGLPAVRAALDGAWNAIRAVSRAAWIEPGRGGAVILLAPRVAGGEHARAVQAGLENTARTLSTEWARFSITPSAIHPGTATTDDEVASLVAFLASPAGAYYSGCAFTLGAVPRSTA